MSDRLTLEKRRVVANLMEVYGSPTVVSQKFAERFAGRDPPSCLTIYRVYAKFVKTGSVADNCRGNSGRSRTGRSDLNIVVVQQAILQSPLKSTTRCSLGTGIPQKTVWPFLTQDLRMWPYHIQVVQTLTAVQKHVRVECCQILAEMNIQQDTVNLMAFSDEATFHTSGHVNRHNTIFFGMENPRVIREHECESPKVNVWWDVTAAGVIGPYFFDIPTVTSDVYLQMVQQYAINELPLQIRLAGYFQQDSALPHFALTVRAYLDHTFPGW